jgi:hypothetical protein
MRSFLYPQYFPEIEHATCRVLNMPHVFVSEISLMCMCIKSQLESVVYFKDVVVEHKSENIRMSEILLEVKTFEYLKFNEK